MFANAPRITELLPGTSSANAIVADARPATAGMAA
jgi:hypothetical protein